MKKILIAIVLIAALFAGCQKDEEITQDIKLDESSLNINDPDNGFRYLEASLRVGGSTYPLWFIASTSSDNQNVFTDYKKQIAYNQVLIDSISMIRNGTFMTTVQYSVPNGFGGVNQPIIQVAIYNIYIKYKGSNTYVDLGLHTSKFVGQTYKYKPNGTNNIVHSGNTHQFTKIERPTIISQSFYSWFYGKNKTRFLYNIINSAGVTSQQYFDPNTGGSSFILNHVM